MTVPLTGECELDQECVTGMLIGLAVPFCMVESSPCLKTRKPSFKYSYVTLAEQLARSC